MKKYIKKQDIIVISLLLLIAALGIAFFIFRIPFSSSADPISYAEVSVDSKVVLKIPLDKPTTIQSPSNPKVVFEVKADGSVGFIASDCPDRVCIASGFIDHPGQIAVCLPNLTTLHIVSNDPASKEVDAVT